jgi:exonuclease SbcD
MRLLHTSDLHIGKKVNEFSLIEDQQHILRQILSIAKEQKPEGILIAGDIYDKGIPNVEAVALFDWFLTELHRLGMTVFMISGNHDSSERIDFGRRIMGKNQIHIAGTYNGRLEKVTLQDEFGALSIYLMPFVKPSLVRRFHPEVENYQDAVEAIIKSSNVDKSKRNILVCHQFITSGNDMPQQCDSETISIGGLDNIDASVFEAFDYVALGHLHGPQRIGRDTIRYSGSPLKYSFSEARQIKSVTLIEITEKTAIKYEKLPLTPLRDMREIKGPIEALTDPKVYSRANTLDYIHATITNEEEIYDAIGKLRCVYPNIMRLDFENSKSVWNSEAKMTATDVEHKSALELYTEFFETQNNVPMTIDQIEIMRNLFEEMAGDKE